MRFGGRVVGGLVILITVFFVVASIMYTRQLQQQRADSIEQLATMPTPAKCAYNDTALCPQADEIVVPDYSSIGLIALGLLLGCYLIINDGTQRKILRALETKQEQIGKGERYALIMSLLTPEEQKIIAAVREQPGISQATLRLRTDMSKAKLSMVLKDLETRGLITKVEDGKTNAVHLKREL